MWKKKKRGIWLAAEPTQPVSSARPHRITIVLGLLSPVVGLAALVISVQSWNTAQNAVFSSQINQRAYVEVLSVTDYHPFQLKAKGTFTIGIRLRNIGNTPAYVSANSLDLYAADAADSPEGDTLFGKEKLKYVPVLTNGCQIGSRDEVTISALWGYDTEFPKLSPDLIVLGELPYKDVFNNLHNIEWGWRMTNQKIKYPVPFTLGLSLNGAHKLRDEYDKALREAKPKRGSKSR